MKIVVIGCGKIGNAMIDSLLKEGHEVVCVDNNAEVISEIADIYDVLAVEGNGVDYDTLLEADVEKAELLIAVTGSDEVNMLSCLLAKRMGAKETIARIRNPEYNDNGLSFIKQNLDISFVMNPELLNALDIFNILKLPSALSVETFSRRNFELIEIKLDDNSDLDGMSLIDLRKKHQQQFLICAVKRGDEVLIPDGNFVLRSGDKIGLVASPTEIQKLLKRFAILKKQARNVMILGGGKIAYYLAKILIKSGNGVKIIDIDRQRCEELSRLLPKATVINGDGADEDLLLEEGINQMDAFVALTGMDEENILVSFFAMAHNVRKVITKVNRNELAAMAEKLGLECIVSPKKTVSDLISRYARAFENSRGSNVESLYKIMGGKAEALEFKVQSDFKYIGVPIKDMKLKQNMLIAGILRKRKRIIPTGEDKFIAGDRVVVIAAGQSFNDLSDIMR